MSKKKIIADLAEGAASGDEAAAIILKRLNDMDAEGNPDYWTPQFIHGNLYFRDMATGEMVRVAKKEMDDETSL